jgi:hypothetical protein
VTTIAFMYNSRLQVCHAGNLLMRLNFPLYAVEYAHGPKDVSVISHAPAHQICWSDCLRENRRLFLPHEALEG